MTSFGYRQCGMCAWFDAIEEFSGRCRYYPPRPTVDPDPDANMVRLTMWAHVYSDDYCAKWVKHPDAPQEGEV